LFFMMKINNSLNQTLKDCRQEDLPELEKKPAQDKMNAWVKLNAGRALMALIAAGVFFVAHQYTRNA
jgi:hypothetical protein